MEAINWDHWLSLDNVFIWEAALLSLELNPEKVKIRKDNFAYTGDPDLLMPLFPLSFNWNGLNESIFQKRYSFINANKRDGAYFLGIHKLDLKKFIAWAAQESTITLPKSMSLVTPSA